MPEPLLRVIDVSRHFDAPRAWLRRSLLGRAGPPARALTEASFSVEPGTTFGIVGESGSGKSTLARLIAGLDRPTAGRIELRSLQRPDGRSRRPRVHMVFQDPYGSLDPRWRVARIVAEPLRALTPRPGRDQVARRTADALRFVGLSPEDGDRFPHAFSGGQRQRIAIARALAAEPDLLVCDEPTSSLDVSVQAQVLGVLLGVQQELGAGLVFISHDLAVVHHVADRLGVMYAGRLVETGDATAIFSRPAHPYTRMLIEAQPDITAPSRPPREIAGEPPNPANLPGGCAFHPRCPLATTLCRERAPDLLPRTDGRGVVACHHADEEPVPLPGSSSSARLRGPASDDATGF